MIFPKFSPSVPKGTSWFLTDSTASVSIMAPCQPLQGVPRVKHNSPLCLIKTSFPMDPFQVNIVLDPAETLLEYPPHALNYKDALDEAGERHHAGRSRKFS